MGGDRGRTLRAQGGHMSLFNLPYPLHYMVGGGHRDKIGRDRGGEEDRTEEPSVIRWKVRRRDGLLGKDGS